MIYDTPELVIMKLLCRIITLDNHLIPKYILRLSFVSIFLYLVGEDLVLFLE